MRRLLDNDPDYKTPGIHKLQITLDGANISTWTYPVARMPTGYLNNVRLELQPSAWASYASNTGMCKLSGAAAAASAASTQAAASPAWVAEKLAALEAACNIMDNDDYQADLSFGCAGPCSASPRPAP